MALKFICPKCKQESRIGIHMENCVVNVPIQEFYEDDDPNYDYPEIEDGEDMYYYCMKCEAKLPVAVDGCEDNLVAWLKRKRYNRKEPKNAKRKAVSFNKLMRKSR